MSTGSPADGHRHIPSIVLTSLSLLSFRRFVIVECPSYIFMLAENRHADFARDPSAHLFLYSTRILFEPPFPETRSDIGTYPRLCQVLAAKNPSQLPVKVS